MKISVIVLLASCAIISNICYTQAAYARSKLAQKEQLKAKLQSFYDTLAQLQEDTEADCYESTQCTWLIGRKQNAAVCCESGGRSFKEVNSRGQVQDFCHVCTISG